MAREGTRAVVTGQSATRVHPAVSSFSTQQWDVDVADDACLVVLPGPAIPYRGARYFQRGRVEMAPTAKVIWGDIWLAGRYERGDASERFVFDRIVQDFEARRSGKLVYRDRFRWDGPWAPDDIDWHFGRGNLASGSLFLSEPLPPGALPEPVAGLRQASFDFDTGASCVRWCGPPAAVTTALVRTALTAAARWVLGPDADAWLLGLSELTPNHWFSTPPG
jgi:urease accessory protein